MSTSPLEGRPCVACGTPVTVTVRPWAARCPSCGAWRSSLEPEIESLTLHEAIDPEARATGLKDLRDGNNAQILDGIAALRPLAGATLLDIGSAHGWFLRAARDRGMTAEGIEPEAAMAAHARRSGLDVRPGYFPQALHPGEQVDVISFNDVLEHIPDLDETLAACFGALHPGGVLSVNIPSATGLGYRVATAMARVGLGGPFERFWQHGLPSPHTHYLPPAALARIIERHGFVVQSTRALRAVERRGLWSRLHSVRRPSPLSVVAFAGLWLMSPLLNRPGMSDIVLVLARTPG